MSGWPQGFSASVARCGLKSDGEAELAVVESERPCRAAGLFTRNRVCAAPVVLSRSLLERSPDRIGAVVINSKNANAVTGPAGLRDAAALAAIAADRGQVLTMSTGVIGQPMPLQKYLDGWATAARGQADPAAVARAMMTTDTHPKWVERELAGTRWVGLAKGAGMIHPDMATLLALVVTDAEIPSAALQAGLAAANQESFACITVDGDSSTNDTLLALANGAAGPAPAGWQAVLADISRELARMIAFDGEGASHRVTLEVSGLADAAAARQVGRTVLTSPLVKTAIAGKDANWGRILAAAGRAGVTFDPDQAGLRWNGLELLRAGAPTNPGADAESQVVAGADVFLQLRLGEGSGRATLWSCDLTHDYISINGDYRS